MQTRALAFLAREVPAWSKENGCFSCHNNGDGARALFEARRRGAPLKASSLRNTLGWITHPAGWDHNKGDPGFSDARLADLQFAGSLMAAMEAGERPPRGAVEEAARRVHAGQAPDGSWPIEPQNPVGSPATYGTILGTFMAWRVLAKADAPETIEAMRRAEAWLRRVKPVSIVSAATLLWADAEIPRGREGPAFPVAECFELLQRAQSREGGWGPYADAPPEPFDTALVVLALVRQPPLAGREAMIQRACAFLGELQQPDGSWPATTRPPGGESYAQRVSTTAWVVWALLSSTSSSRGNEALDHQDGSRRVSLVTSAATRRKM